MSNIVEIKSEQLDLKEITDRVSAPDCGAISLFVGTTRDNMNGKEVIKLEYEAYETMALKEMEKICQEIREKWPNVKHIAIVHRLGEVKIEKESIIIAISSAHRKDSLEACAYCIDKVKETVPIWKKVRNNNQNDFLTLN